MFGTNKEEYKNRFLSTTMQCRQITTIIQGTKNDAGILAVVGQVLLLAFFGFIQNEGGNQRQGMLEFWPLLFSEP
jgi:hypothetical protein